MNLTLTEFSTYVQEYFPFQRTVKEPVAEISISLKFWCKSLMIYQVYADEVLTITI